MPRPINGAVKSQGSLTHCDFLKSYNIKIGRWGGDEFLAVCYNINASELMTIAENMRIKISEAEFDTVGNITCSIGITEINKNDKVKEAFERVDKAMYSAKSRLSVRLTD